MSKKKNRERKQKHHGRPHGAWCAICAKPREYRRRILARELIKADAADAPVREGRHVEKPDPSVQVVPLVARKWYRRIARDLGGNLAHQLGSHFADAKSRSEWGDYYIDARILAHFGRLALGEATDHAAIVARLQHDLAECFKWSGADSDGNEDWRLAPRAVEEVKRLRADYDAESATVARLTQEREAVNRLVHGRLKPIRELAKHEHAQLSYQLGMLLDDFERLLRQRSSELDALIAPPRAEQEPS